MREERFSIDGPIHLHCTVSTGEITVLTGEDDEATVVLQGTPELVEKMRVELVDDRLIVAEPPSSLLDLVLHGKHRLDVVATIPRVSEVTTKTASGDTKLEGTFGSVHAQSASGDLEAIGEIVGEANLKSASGDLRLGHVRGDVSLQTVSGDLRADTLDGSAIVNAVSGDVVIGSVREGTVTVRNVSGDVTVGIAPGSTVDLDASTASGNLRSDVPLDAAPAGDDAPTVVVRGATASGDFRIVRAAPAAPAATA